MTTFDFQICCRALGGALRPPAEEADGETFLVGVGVDGSPFYKVGCRAGGLLMSIFTDPLAFCPFCGRAVTASAGAARAAAPEATRRAPGRTQGPDTVLATLAARGAGTGIHVSEF